MSFRQFVPKVDGAHVMQFATDAPAKAVIYVGLIPGTWDQLSQTREGDVLTLRFRGLKPGEAKVSLMVEGTQDPTRFLVMIE